MRMGPFSNPEVVKYINEHFVPVYASNEDYLAGKRGEQEKQLLLDVRKHAADNGLQAGSVQVYLLKPDGKVVDTMHVAKAAQVKLLMQYLELNVARVGGDKGKRLVPLRRLSTAPEVSDGEIVFRIAAQFTDGIQDLPVESWVVLKKDEWSEFVPKSKEVGYQWQLSDDTAQKLLVQFYPYAQNWDHGTDQVEFAKLECEVIEASKSSVVAIIQGKLQMTHLVWTDKGKRSVTSGLMGYINIQSGKPPIVVMVSKESQFNSREFDALLHSVE